MASQKSPRAKSQTLSLRLDPKTRFVLEFVAKLRRQSITTVVEDAIRNAGETAVVGSSSVDQRTWLAFWDISEGVRTLLLLADPEIPSSFDDDELRDFIQRHIEFFSETRDLRNPDRTRVPVLWPKIERYMEQWRQTRETDPFQVGRDMGTALLSAGLKAPLWPPPARHSPSGPGMPSRHDPSAPPQKSRPPKTLPHPAPPSDPDDEIPF